MFESIRVADGIPLLIEAHIERLQAGMNLLGYDNNPELQTPNITGWVKKLADVNNIKVLGRARLMVFRSDGGLFKPETDKAEWILELTALPDDSNQPFRQIEAVICEEFPKPASRLSNIKSCNALVSVVSRRFAATHGADDAIIVNTMGRICEATSSNIFIVKNGILVTPALSEGCVAGIMRNHVIATLQQQGYQISEGEITREMMLEADEVFLTNAISRIISIKKIHNRNFSFSMTLEIIGRVMVG
ncbi:MAG: aminotransferase class IV [Bacteroidetes bacterium]|nr:aminotransferase class IV [Bacteroidota bacterium]MBU1720738.1 aminotransferase class IV [Bacteroidota bacterium]